MFRCDPALAPEINNQRVKAIQQAIHVAIDRWTGGAADGMLYSTLEPMGIDWEPICLDVNLSAVKERQLEVIALLLVVLRDMMLAKIPLGYATNRGMGAITVERINIKGEGLDESLSKLTEVTLTGSNLEKLDSSLRKMLTEKWRAWIDSEAQGEAA